MSRLYETSSYGLQAVNKVIGTQFVPFGSCNSIKSLWVLWQTFMPVINIINTN